MSPFKELSVVVPAVNLLSDVNDCLAALDELRTTVGLEVILVNRLGATVHDHVAQRFSWVTIVDVPRTLSIPLMRAVGFRHATKPAVGVIEDHVIVPPDWGRRMLEALNEGASVVGGSVENAATDSLLDSAAFLCEYSHLIAPIPGGSVRSLTGNNVVYRRSLLELHRDAAEQGEWENHLHDVLLQGGAELTCRPEIVVGHKKHYTFGEYMSQRYLYARSYAGKRTANSSLIARIAYGLAACALPPVLLYRIVARVTAKRSSRGLLVRSTPLISLFLMAWAAGEVVGSLFGEGDAMQRVC